MSEIDLIEPERHYLPLENYILDWNMLLYGEEEESGFQIDWNKLIYNEEQLLDFSLRQQEKMLRPEHYEYLFSAPAQRSEMEKFFLTQSGFCIDEEEDAEEDEINDIPIKRLVIDPALEIEDPSDAK
jgi:tRNA splicing endonuclease